MIASRAGSFMGRSTLPTSTAERDNTAALLPDHLKGLERRTAVEAKKEALATGCTERWEDASRRALPLRHTAEGDVEGRSPPLASATRAKAPDRGVPVRAAEGNAYRFFGDGGLNWQGLLRLANRLFPDYKD